MESRKNELFNLLLKYCMCSSIRYKDEYRYLSSIKLLIQKGEIFFISSDRHLDLVIREIPNWDIKEDMKIIDELNDNIHFKMCEGEKYNGSYTYSIMLLKDDMYEE